MSNYDPEPYIPEAESDFLDPRQGAYNHPDFGAELGSYEQDTLTVNDILPGQPHAVDVTEQNIKATHPKGERQNPVYTVDAPIDLMSTYQTPISSTVPTKIVLPNQYRVNLILQNIAAAGNLFFSGVSGSGAINGLKLTPGQSVTLGYTGEIWAYADTAGVTAAVGEFTRMQDS